MEGYVVGNLNILTAETLRKIKPSVVSFQPVTLIGIFHGILLLGCIYWLASAVMAILTIRKIPPIENIDNPPLESYPKISLIIAASNEEDSIENSIRNRLQSDYPNLEFIIIDDRSIDSTYEIIEKLAHSDVRIIPVRVEELPSSWLGKPHAMNEGVKLASGEYLLFTDADIFFSQGILQRAIEHVEARDIDQLGIAPSLWADGFFLQCVLGNFLRIFSLAARFWAVDKPHFKPFTGVGAFNLVRKKVFDKTPGFEWLKMEIADDVALARMIADVGGKCAVLNGRNFLKVRWYKSLREMAVGLERGMWVNFGRFSIAKIIISQVGYLLFEYAPLIALLSFGYQWMQVLGAISTIIAIVTSSMFITWGGGRWWHGLFYPVGSVLMAGIGIRGGYLGRKRGGIVWRGTFYSDEDLKKGVRIPL